MRRGIGLGLVAVALVGAIVVVATSRGSRDLRIVVPPGTMERIEAGEQVELLPRVLEVRVGDRLVIVNDDDATHQVGPYLVGPGQRLEQRFTRPGRIEGLCTLHPSGEVAIVVRD